MFVEEGGKEVIIRWLPLWQERNESNGVITSFGPKLSQSTLNEELLLRDAQNMWGLDRRRLVFRLPFEYMFGRHNV